MTHAEALILVISVATMTAVNVGLLLANIKLTTEGLKNLLQTRLK